MANLKILELRNHQLSKLPETIGLLSELRELSLPTIHKLEPAFWKIWILGINYNPLKRTRLGIPANLSNLKKLELLNLKGCQLQVVAEDICQLPNLAYLDLNDTQLSVIPDCIANLKNLRTLGLGSNELATLPSSFQQLQQLIRLDLSNNQFTEIPSVIYSLKGLQELDLSGNPIRIEALLKRLKEDLPQCRIIF